MSAKVLNKIIDYIYDLKEQGYDVDVALHGGEPMLYRDKDAIWEFVNACNEMYVPITMTTNLTYKINDEHLILFSKFKQADGEPLVLTSWDYKIRFKPESLENTWKNAIKRLVENDINVQPIISLTKILIEDKTPEDIFKYMSKLGIKHLNFERLTCTGRAEYNSDELMPTNEQVDTWLCEAYKLWKSKYSNIYIPLFDALEWAAWEGKYIGCRARQCVRVVRTFNPDGSMATCPNIPTDTVGNIRRIKSVEEVGNVIEGNKKYKALMDKERIKDNRCYSCEYYSICNGDCFQLRWDETGCPGLKNTITEVLKHQKMEEE
jgi:radical SAM protein with 4Fe4S-binding SPASM domain